MGNNKTDMSLTVNVTVSGTVANGVVSATATYAQGDSVPDSPGVVGSDGDIDLKKMKRGSGAYTKATDITFNLSGEIKDADGNPLAFSFPQPPAEAIKIARRNGKGGGAMTVAPGANAMQALIDDDDDDGHTYEYCIQLWVLTNSPSSGDGVTGQLDPQIVNRDK